MNLPETLLNFLRKRLAQIWNTDVTILSADPLPGGSINNVFRLRTTLEDLVLKLNLRKKYPGMFEAEARGLSLLARADVIRTPVVVDHGEFEEQSFLLMSHIAEGSSNKEFPKNFGEGLARLHRKSADSFGLDHNNYIGSLPQVNTRENSWAEFFALHRLEPQLKMAYEAGHFHRSENSRFHKLMQRLGELVPEEKPALLHGDLWSGNYLVDTKSQPVLIDPAVYYGHREVDLAMMHLFGGFPAEIFNHYDEAFALESGWRERVDLHNLYPLLVHVNLFGGSYVQQVKNVLERFA